MNAVLRHDRGAARAPGGLPHHLWLLLFLLFLLYRRQPSLAGGGEIVSRNKP